MNVGNEAEWQWANAQDQRKQALEQSMARTFEKYGGSLQRLATKEVKVKRLSPDAVMPTKAHADDAGFDLYAAADVIIEPGETVIVPTGLAFELPPGYEMQVRPRSGVTVKTKLRVQLGTIDANYRGEVGVIVDNVATNEGKRRTVDVDKTFKLVHIDGSESRLGVFNNYPVYKIRKGDRIAQAVITRLPAVQLTEVDALSVSERGSNGYGSTGVSTKEAE